MDILTETDDWQGGVLLGATVEFKLLDAAADEGNIEGYGATFGSIDHGLDTITPGAFSETLNKHIASGSSPAMLWNHRPNEPIGKWTHMGEDGRGLRVKGKLNLDTATAQRVRSHLQHGDVSSLSIGYSVPRGGAESTRTGRTLHKIELHEVSVVAVPMDPTARVTAVKSIASAREMEEALRESGFSKADARKITAGGWPIFAGEKAAEPDAAAPVFAELLKRLDAGVADLKALRPKPKTYGRTPWR